MTNDELKAWRARLQLGEAGMAAYLGVPVTTYRKWENGTRSQDASTRRLFEVLQLVEDDLIGGLHEKLLREATASVEWREPKRKGRKPKEIDPKLARTLDLVKMGNAVIEGSMITAPVPDVPDWMKRGA